MVFYPIKLNVNSLLLDLFIDIYLYVLSFLIKNVMSSFQSLFSVYIRRSAVGSATVCPIVTCIFTRLIGFRLATGQKDLAEHALSCFCYFPDELQTSNGPAQRMCLKTHGVIPMVARLVYRLTAMR